MTDQTPPDQGQTDADALPNGTDAQAAAANLEAQAAAEAEAKEEAEAEAQAKAEAEANAKAEADKAAQAAGFADAATKAAFDAEAAKPKPKRAAPKRKGGGFSVKMPTLSDYDLLCGIARVGGVAQLVLSDGRKPIEGLAPVSVAMTLRRGRPANAAAAGFAGANLTSAVTISHVFAIAEGEKVGAGPLAIAELAAPITLQPGEQVKMDAGSISFFAPPARD